MIPNIFHFIFFTDEGSEFIRFPLVHYLAIKSAYVLNKPEKIYFYLNYEPEGEWWDKIKPCLEVINIEPPSEIFGNQLMHFAHKSDVLRLKLLIEKGGIYMDLDTICKRPFENLLKYNFVIGKQGRFRKKFCNGIIMSEKNSEFANLWFEQYKTFRSKGKDKYWAEHSSKISYILSKKYPSLLHIVPSDYFHYPLYYPFHLKKLFEKCIDYKNAYCHHLWEGGSWNKYLKNLTQEYIKKVDTTYNIIARKFL